jgi:phospholipase C
MAYNSNANVVVTNNSGGTANITLSHRYSSDPAQIKKWSNVANGATTSPALSVGFNTGFIHGGLDDWWIGIEVLDGPNKGTFSSEGYAEAPGKECMLSSEDNGKSLTFGVDTKLFMINLPSGNCTTALEQRSAASVANAKVSLNKAAPAK